MEDGNDQHLLRVHHVILSSSALGITPRQRNEVHFGVRICLIHPRSPTSLSTGGGILCITVEPVPAVR